MSELTEKFENLENMSYIDILKLTAKRFRTLSKEAEEALTERRDSGTYRGKLIERANLLVSLPDLLTGKLEEVDDERKENILITVEGFADLADKAVKEEGIFRLGTLLTDMGSKIGDMNNLEEFISSLEE